MHLQHWAEPTANVHTNEIKACTIVLDVWCMTLVLCLHLSIIIMLLKLFIIKKCFISS